VVIFQFILHGQGAVDILPGQGVVAEAMGLILGEGEAKIVAIGLAVIDPNLGTDVDAFFNLFDNKDCQAQDN
jgi:hypothetical protein